MIELNLQLFLSYSSSRKISLPPQASSEQADAQSRPQVSREMLPVHCHAWTCLSTVTLECALPAKRFPPQTVNEKEYPTQSLSFILTENQWTLLKLTNTIKNLTALLQQRQKNKRAQSQIKIHLKNTTKIGKYKKLNYKVSKNNHTTNEDKNTFAD